MPITSHHLLVIIIFSHSFHELFETGTHYHRKSFNWARSKLTDVHYLPPKDCWSDRCTCCVGTREPLSSHILTCDIDIANLYVRPSVRLSVTFLYQMRIQAFSILCTSFPGAKSPQRELSLHGTFVPWNIRSCGILFLGSKHSKNFRSYETIVP